MNKEERKQRLKNRQSRAVKNRDQQGLNRLSVIDISKLPEGVKDYELKHGRAVNAFDLIPFIVSQDWYKKLRTYSGEPTGLEVGDYEYKLEVPVHRNIGPENAWIVCPQAAFGHRCPICDELYDLRKIDKDERTKEEQKKIDDWKISWRNYYYIWDFEGGKDEDDEPGFKIIKNQSYHLFEKYLLSSIKEFEDEVGDTVAIADPDEGFTLEFKGKLKSLGEGKNKNEFVEAESVDFIERNPDDPPYDDEFIESNCIPLDSLMIIMSYEQILELHTGGNEGEEGKPKDEESGDQGGDDKGSSGRSRGRGAAKDKDDNKGSGSGGRGSGRGRGSSKDEKEEETGGNDDPQTCPFNFVFGDECGDHPECADEKNGCPEETYNLCQKVQSGEVEKTATNEPEEKEEDKGSSGRGRGRGGAKKDDDKDSGSSSGRGRGRGDSAGGSSGSGRGRGRGSSSSGSSSGGRSRGRG